MVKQSRAWATRELIVRGAATTFERFGYGGATMADIVADAGVTRGALYFHFESKQELAQAVIAEQHSKSIATGREVIDRGDPGLESIIRMSFEFATLLITDPVVRAGIRLTLEHGTFEAPSREPYEDWVEVTRALLDRAGHTDLHKAADTEALARFLVATFTGVQLLSQVLVGRSDLYRRVGEMWDIVLPALVPARKVPHFRSVISGLLRSVESAAHDDAEAAAST